MVSKKYKSVKEIPTDKPLNVGVSGLGITTHLVAVEVAKKYPNMNIIPFKSTNEAMLATLGGQTDFSVNFVGDSYQYVTSKEEKNRLYMMGVTGNKPVIGSKPFVDQGFSPAMSYMNAPAHLVVPKTMPEAQFKELREIFVKASRSQTVLDSYKADFCASLNQMSDEQIDPWFAASNVRWKKLTSTITLK